MREKQQNKKKLFFSPKKILFIIQNKPKIDMYKFSYFYLTCPKISEFLSKKFVNCA